MDKLASQLFIVIIFLFTNSIKAQSVNIESVNAYWKIVDRLKQGDTLSRAAWKDFLNLEGNKIYVQNQNFSENFLESYRKTLQYVYNLKNEDKLKKMMDDKLNNWMAYKINQYKANEDELKQYVSHLEESAYLDSIYLKAWDWLPKKLHTKSPNTQIFIIAIDNDALVDQGRIVFTLWSVYNQDKLKYGILGGHEMHHVLRKPINFDISPSEEGLFYLLQTILNEGSADMIDKKYSFDKAKDVVYEYHFEELLLTKTDSIIREIDTAIQEMSRTNGQKYPSIKQFRILMNYSSGHNPGYYMADIIVKSGYRKELIKNIQNPFQYIILYNKAAKKDKLDPPLFSDVTIDYIKQLEKKYWKHN
jgi:hypothetical protein